jgi:hypothetical protein
MNRIIFIISVLLVFTIKMADSNTIPVATAVQPNSFVMVDSEQLSVHLAKEEAKLLEKKYEFDRAETKRLNDVRLQQERVLHEQRLKWEQEELAKERASHELRLKHEQEELAREQERKEAVWRLKHPFEAREKDELARAKARLAEEAAKTKWRLEQEERDREQTRRLMKEKNNAEIDVLLADTREREHRSSMRLWGSVIIGGGLGMVLYSFI